MHYNTIQFNIEIILNIHNSNISAQSRRKWGHFFNFCPPPPPSEEPGLKPLLKDILYRQRVIYQQYIEKNHLFSTQILRNKTISRYKSVAIMIEKWVNFKRDYLEKSYLRENCGYDGSDNHRRPTIS